jgi:phosphoribosyl 1,2-cyclic phosphate phosphodiesterase
MEKLGGLRVLVLNALHHQEHYSHLNLEQAVDLARRLGAEQTYFTHISHRMGLHAEVNRLLPQGMALGHDGLEMVLDG